ncbi:MAG TPA: CAAX prenyl protease-related protein [Verrucomicrobiae bacterium]
MRLLTKTFANPIYARAAPYVIFVLLTACQGKLGVGSAYWFYLAKTIVGVWLIYEMRPLVSEMRWAISWEAVVVGLLIFAVWVGLEGRYPKFFHAPSTGNPALAFGPHSALPWFFNIVHIVGMTLVVPPIEEAFFRSFVYRYIISPNFRAVPLSRFQPLAFCVTILFFGSTHNEWLPGILCGAAYQWLVIRKNRLGDAMTAHAITNLLLGIYIVRYGAWQLW